MKLITASKLGTLPSLSPEAASLLDETAEHFLRGGGAITLDEWSILSTSERAALKEAGDRIRIELAWMTGMAAQNLDAAATVISELDGGAMRLQVAGLRLQAQVDKVSSKIMEKANG